MRVCWLCLTRVSRWQGIADAASGLARINDNLEQIERDAREIHNFASNWLQLHYSMAPPLHTQDQQQQQRLLASTALASSSSATT